MVRLTKQHCPRCNAIFDCGVWYDEGEKEHTKLLAEEKAGIIMFLDANCADCDNEMCVIGYA